MDNLSRKYINKRDLHCINCGYDGHSFKNCNEPIKSYGIILLSLDVNDKLKKQIINCDQIDILNDNSQGIMINDYKDIELFGGLKNCINFLLIRRKHTLGFIEFIRGRYSIENVDGIIFLFKQMTPMEINKIKLLTFDDLWDEVWGENKHKPTYQNEYSISKDKFNKLKSEENGYLSLDFYISNVVPSWDYAEWGFPKGRRNIKETDMVCAIREFEEESGLLKNDFEILDNIDPICESFIGTNGINYEHIYYVAISTNDKIPTIDSKNINQIHEIGDIKFMTYEDCMKIIRPYHTERQKIITCLYIHIINNLISNIK